MNKKLLVGLGLCVLLGLAGPAAAFDLFGSIKGAISGGEDSGKPAASSGGETGPVVDLSGLNASALNTRGLGFIGNTERIAVPSYRLGVVVRSGVRATASSGRVAMESSVDLTGISEQQLRSLADKAYANFIEQLKATGRPLVPMDEIRAAPGFARITPTPVPFAKKPFADARSVVMVSPNGMPLVSTHFDSPLSDQGTMSLGNWRAINQLSVDLKAVVLIPTVIIDFAELKGSGHSAIGSSASISVKPGLYLVDVLSGLGAYHARIALAGELGKARLEKRIAIGQAGEFVETSRVGNRKEVEWWNTMAVNQPNNMLKPGNAYEYATYEYRVDPPLFDKVVMDGLSAMNRAYAEVAAQYKP